MLYFFKNYVDAMEIAKLLVPNCYNFKLLTVAKYLKIADSQEHRAMEDVELTIKVFERLMKQGKKKGLEIQF